MGSAMRPVCVAALLAVAAFSLNSPLVAAERFTWLNGTAALTIAVVVFCVALFVAAGPVVARMVDWHRAALDEDAPGHGERGPYRFMTSPSLQILAATGLCLILSGELVALSRPSDAVMQALPGIVMGLVLFRMCTSLLVHKQPPSPGVEPDDVGESLQRSISRIESRITWAEGSRADWDLRVRPVLARQFEMATKVGQRRLADPDAFRATGLMLFGPQLWQWVDPDNIAGKPGTERAPGRKVLEDIIECLEHV